MKKHIAILGSTGSIGTQAMDVIDKNPDKFEVEVLTAKDNTKLLIEQARKVIPNVVVIANDKKYKEEYPYEYAYNEIIELLREAGAK